MRFDVTLNVRVISALILRRYLQWIRKIIIRRELASARKSYMLFLEKDARVLSSAAISKQIIQYNIKISEFLLRHHLLYDKRGE